jgi:hypothetical protein
MYEETVKCHVESVEPVNNEVLFEDNFEHWSGTESHPHSFVIGTLIPPMRRFSV